MLDGTAARARNHVLARSRGRHLATGGRGQVEKDDIVIFEVMADDLDPVYWRGLRAQLEADLQQSEVVVRGKRSKSFER